MNPCVGCAVNCLNVVNIIGADVEDYIAFLQNHGVLKRVMLCPHCGEICRIRLRPIPAFRCQKTRMINHLRRKCNFLRSLKTNTWLNHTHLSFEKVIKFITIWLTVPHPRQNYIMETLGLSSKTVVDWSNFCREICIDSMLFSDVDIVGGPGMIVEVDEAKFGKRKNYMGREVEGSWIFGAIERETNRCFFERIQDRSANTLMDVIMRRISPGTTIISEGGYNPIANQQLYQHLTANHSIIFIDPITGAHTQNIERRWREVRSEIPRYGRRKNHSAGYLAEYYWKSRHALNDRLHHFLLEVAQQYDPNNG